MWNVSLALWVLTWDFSKIHLYILNFDKPTEILTEEKWSRYTEFIKLLSITKGSVNMNSYWLEKGEMWVLLLDFWLRIRIENTSSF